MSLLTNLNCYLTLDEAANTTRNDSTANNNNFTDVLSNVGSVAGLIGNAANFGSTLGQLLDNASQILPSGAFSVSLWAKFSANQTASATLYLWSQELAASPKQFIGYTTASDKSVNSIIVGVTGATDVTYLVSPGTTSWHHLVITFDPSVSSGTVTLYYDGVSQGTATSKTFLNTAIVTCVGNDGTTGNSAKGAIDECGMWARALTSSEVTQLYNSGAGLAYPFTSGTPVFVLDQDTLRQTLPKIDHTNQQAIIVTPTVVVAASNQGFHPIFPTQDDSRVMPIAY